MRILISFILITLLQAPAVARSEHFIQQGCSGGVTGSSSAIRIYRDGRIIEIDNPHGSPQEKKELGNDSALADRIFEVATTNGFFEVMKQREYANMICFIDYYSPRKKHRVSWIIDDNKLPKVIITLLEEFGKLRK